MVQLRHHSVQFHSSISGGGGQNPTLSLFLYTIPWMLNILGLIVAIAL